MTAEARVVTISATYGAGGAAVGLLLAERLGLPFADRLIKAHGGSPPRGEGVTERLRTTDTTRARYVQRIYGCDPADPKLYHLVVDATVLTVDACTQLLADAAGDYWAYDDGNLPGAVARARTKAEELRARRRE